MTKQCNQCGEDYEHTNQVFTLCPTCEKQRARAYDDHVDPDHWYHQHDPDRATRG